MTFIPFSVASALSFENALVLEVQQCVDALGAFDVNVSTLSPVATAGSAPGDEFLSPEGETAVPAVSGNYLDFCVINKQARGSAPHRKR
jgi:hypothetical protein